MPDEQSLSFAYGEHWNIIANLKNSDDGPLDLTGATVKLRVGGMDFANLDEFTGTVTNATAGKVEWSIPPSEYGGEISEAGTYRWEVQATLADGVVTTQAVGTLVLAKSLFA